MFPHGDTVTRLRGTPIVDPYSGEATGTDWSHPSRLDFPGCAVWQESSVESPDQMGVQRTKVVTVTKCAVPFGADFLPSDRFEVRGRTYEVVGDIEDWRSPFTGWEPGSVVTGVRTDG